MTSDSFTFFFKVKLVIGSQITIESSSQSRTKPLEINCLNRQEGIGLILSIWFGTTLAKM